MYGGSIKLLLLSFGCVVKSKKRVEEAVEE
jgi:hypothetical protein